MFGAHDFRRIEGGCDEAIGFGGKIAGRRDTATDTTGANEGTNEELLIKLVLARDAVIVWSHLLSTKIGVRGD